MATPPDSHLIDPTHTVAAAAALRGRRTGASSPIAATDGELLAQFAKAQHGARGDDDRAAFARLVDRHGAMVWRVCRRLLNHPQDAEDAFQATFLILARRACAIRASESVAGWLYRVAYRTALAAKRRAKKRREAPLEGEPLAPAEKAFPDLVARQTAGVLMEELDRLPAKYRTPLVMRYLEGCSRRAIADQTDTTIAAVQGRLARGKQLLRSRLVRRGVSLSAAMAVVGLGAGSAEAAPPQLVSSTTSGASALVTGGSVAASAAALSLYREGVRAMLMASIGKPAAAAAGVCVVLAALAAPPALLAADEEEAAPGLALNAEVTAESTEVEAEPTKIAQRSESNAATVGERPGRPTFQFTDLNNTKALGDAFADYVETTRRVYAMQAEEEGDADYSQPTVGELLLERDYWSNKKAATEARRELLNLRGQAFDLETPEAVRLAWRIEASQNTAEWNLARGKILELERRLKHAAAEASSGEEAAAPLRIAPDEKLREKILDLLAYVPGIRVQVGVSGQLQNDAMASIVVPEDYVQAVYRAETKDDDPNGYENTQKEVRYQIQRLVNSVLPRLEPEEDEYLRVQVEFAETPVSAAQAKASEERAREFRSPPTITPGTEASPRRPSGEDAADAAVLLITPPTDVGGSPTEFDAPPPDFDDPIEALLKQAEAQAKVAEALAGQAEAAWEREHGADIAERLKTSRAPPGALINKSVKRLSELAEKRKQHVEQMLSRVDFMTDSLLVEPTVVRLTESPEELDAAVERLEAVVAQQTVRVAEIRERLGRVGRVPAAYTDAVQRVVKERLAAHLGVEIEQLDDDALRRFKEQRGIKTKRALDDETWAALMAEPKRDAPRAVLDSRTEASPRRKSGEDAADDAVLLITPPTDVGGSLSISDATPSAPDDSLKQQLLEHKERLKKKLEELATIEGQAGPFSRGSEAQQKLQAAIAQVNAAIGRLVVQEAGVEEALEATKRLLGETPLPALPAGPVAIPQPARPALFPPKPAAPTAPSAGWPYHPAYQYGPDAKMKQGRWNVYHRPSELNPHGWATIAELRIGQHAPILLPGDKRPRPHVRLKSVKEADGPYTSPRLYLQLIDEEQDGDNVWVVNGLPEVSSAVTLPGRDQQIQIACLSKVTDSSAPVLLLLRSRDPSKEPALLPSLETAQQLLYAGNPQDETGRIDRTSPVATEAPRRIDPTDGKPDGKKSLGGGGHLVRFDLPESVTRLKAIRIHGSRYGTRQAPKEDFEIAFLDEDRAEILAVEHAAYGLFRRGEEKWTTVKFDDPVEVPQTFWIAVDFAPHQTKGVYLSYDTSTGGERSMTGLAQDDPAEHKPVDFGGDWMVQLLPERE